jgi:hypothetical protein
MDSFYGIRVCMSYRILSFYYEVCGRRCFGCGMCGQNVCELFKDDPLDVWDIGLKGMTKRRGFV